MIEVKGLTRRFGAHIAVDDISFEVGQGEVVGFLGLNGAGKTTTLRVLAGYLPATSGSVKVAGFDVLRDSIEVRRRIGYLPENVPLYREQRVEEMLTMQARLHGVPRAERERRIGEVLERVGVLDRRRQVIAGLSRGLRQRVGLAVALLPKPEVLILDEPTSGLDPMQRQEVRVLLRELSSDHTVLLSSHILPEVEAVCPRTIIIHRGKIVADGTKEEMVRDLGRGSRVRLEAFFGEDLEGALKSVSAIAGAGKIHDLGRLGIHHVLEIEVTEDLREDFG
ncbi:MAG: ABC transporter ATP-binding protein, partial [Planctomycetota bacterium]|nr:ABC transporter ATP-binding protein [Planctomycetota bacterium]